MILLANFINAIAGILHFILMLYIWILVFRAILSWIRVPSLYQVQVLLYRFTEPVLAPVRKYFPPYKFGGIDISPIIVFVLLFSQVYVPLCPADLATADFVVVNLSWFIYMSYLL